MPTRREINELYSAANELKRVKKERDALKAELETANHLLSMRLINSGSETVIAELKAKLAECECEDDFECPNCGEVNPSTSCGLPNCGLIQEGTP